MSVEAPETQTTECGGGEIVKNEQIEESSLTGTADLSCDGCEDDIGRLHGEAEGVGNDADTYKGDEEKENTRKVRFSTIEIRDYPIIVGDNPAVSVGVPLTIDWIHVGCYESSLDDYEQYKPLSRSSLELKMPRPVRESLLRRLGFTRADLMEGTKAANIGRHRRTRTRETMTLAPLQEVLERTCRATKNATFRRGAKRREKESLATFCLPHTEKSRLSCSATEPMVNSGELSI